MGQVRMAGFDMGASGTSGTPSASVLPHHVIKKGKIFQAGDYPDKNFSITPEEMMEAIINFESVPIDIEHRPSIFDGKMGRLFHVEAAENGVDLMGSIAIPNWMNEAIGDASIKVSTEWDVPTKRLTKLALTLDPRVPDAVMLAKFNTAYPDQSVHPEQKEKKMTFMDKLAAALKGMTPEEYADMMAEGKSEAIHDSQSLNTIVNRESADVPSTQAPSEATFSAYRAEMDKLKAEVDRQTTINAQFAAEARLNKARDFVKEQVRVGKMLPFQQGPAAALLSRAMADDEQDSTKVTFSKVDGSTAELSRTELLEAFISELPKHSLFEDHSFTEAPEGSVLLSASHSGDSKQEAHEQGVQFGKAWAERNTPPPPSNNGNGK